MELDSDRFSLLGMLHMDLQRLVHAHPHILSAVVIVEEASVSLAGIKLFLCSIRSSSAGSKDPWTVSTLK